MSINAGRYTHLERELKKDNTNDIIIDIYKLLHIDPLEMTALKNLTWRNAYFLRNHLRDNLDIKLKERIV